MGIQKDRTRVHVRGLGDLAILMIEPTPATAFVSVGNIKGTTLSFVHETEEIIPEHGKKIDLLSRSRSVQVQTNLMQSSIDELTLLRDAEGKVYAYRYFGMPGPGRFQYFCIEQGKFQPGMQVPFVPGERLLQATIHAFWQELVGYEVPEIYVAETAGRMNIDACNLWIDPDGPYHIGTVKALDISGFRRHGTITADYAGIWQASGELNFLRFDGTNDAVDFGDILNDDASGDFIIEAWVRIQGANASLQEILGKKTVESTNSAGYTLVRNTSNQVAFKLASGSAAATVVTSATLLQNVWKHVAVSIDRNGNGQMYLNGAADGSAVSVAAIGTGTNALSLYLGRDGTNFGQVDIGRVRFHKYTGGALPSAAAITAMLTAHYNAEKTRYGL